MYKDITDLIKSIYPQKDFIALHEPQFLGNEKKYVNQAIDSTFVSSVGEFVNKFEADFAKYIGTKYAVATSNGTAGLHASLHCAGVTHKDEVITQALSFVATCNAIHYCGAEPVFLDIDPETLSLSAAELKKFLNECCEIKNQECFNKTTGKRIAACVPMHSFGHPAEVDAIADLCNEYNISLIEDAAEAMGSEYKNKKIGCYGDLAVFSFNGNKIMTTGGGGMIVTDDEHLAQRLKFITTTAKVPHKWHYEHSELGFNYRLPNLNAALGCAQLEQIDLFLSAKRNLAKKYKAYFETSDIEFVNEPKNSQSNFWLNAILLKSEKDRDEFLKFSNENSVMTRPVWKLLCDLPMYSKCLKMNLTISRDIERRLVNIPSTPPL